MVPVQRFVKPISTLSPPLKRGRRKKSRAKKEKLSREFADWSDKNENKTSAFRRRLMKMFGYTSFFLTLLFVLFLQLSSTLLDYWMNENIHSISILFAIQFFMFCKCCLLSKIDKMQNKKRADCSCTGFCIWGLNTVVQFLRHSLRDQKTATLLKMNILVVTEKVH